MSLLDLPTELLDNILSLVATKEPPSTENLHEEPSLSSLTSSNHPLKNLRRSCQLLRSLSQNNLFSFLKSKIKDIPELISFVRKQELRGRIRSLVLYASTLEEVDSATLWSLVQDAVDAIDPSSVTFMLPPATFEAILPYQLEMEHAWAFNIPLQILRLEQNQERNQQARLTTSGTDHKLFGLRPWVHMTFNEGSSVQAYSTYEFFSKRPPSVFYPKVSEPSFNPFPSVYKNILPRIVSLDYIAVFPIDRRVLPYGLFPCLKSLKHLRIRLAPTKSNNVLDNPKILGRCSRSDLWIELRSAYVTFTGVWIDWARSLEDVTFLDYSNATVREIIDSNTTNCKRANWRPTGEGRWTKAASSEGLVLN